MNSVRRRSEPTRHPKPVPAWKANGPLPPKWRLLALALVLLFLLLAWGVWWFFDYKIRSLARP